MSRETDLQSDEEWAQEVTLTQSCQCVQHARVHLSQAQKLNEVDGMQGHAFFIMGCAVNSLINHIDGKHNSL